MARRSVSATLRREADGEVEDIGGGLSGDVVGILEAPLRRLGFDEDILLETSANVEENVKSCE